MTTKVCPKCRVEKTLDEFYTDRSTKDGYTSTCKECRAEYIRAYYQRPGVRELKREANRRFFKTDRGKALKEKHRKIYYQKHLHKMRAHQKLNNECAAGRVVRPDMCGKCGKLCKPEAHHDDYSKPLDVRWLCTRCHTDYHMANGDQSLRQSPHQDCTPHQSAPPTPSAT